MDEKLLPENILKKAHISTGGEYSWHKEDFIEVIEAARSIGLASIGGNVQYIFPDGIYDLYWLTYDSKDWKPGEAWADYVDRSATEVIEGFMKLCSTTNFHDIAREERFAHKRVILEGEPNSNLWFINYFMSEASIPAFENWKKMMNGHLKASG